ncbi:MAG: glycosyltransferase [Actinomycetota bacterium]
MIGVGELALLDYAYPVLGAIEWFLILFPGVSAVLAIATSLEYVRQSRRAPDLHFSSEDIETARLRWPSLTVVIPARNEQAHIADTIESVQRIDWPTVRIIVVDDGSTDGTADILRSFGPSITVLSKSVNEGKARALNDAISSSSDGLVMIVDADCIVPPQTANLMARQFVKSDTIGAVTANPRVTKTSTFIEKLQAIEFSATVSATRRGQAVWGRILTMSGICTLLRRDALDEVGLFDASQPTEDIEMTWRLNLAGWRVTYEPEAVVGMLVPTTLKALIVQRRRWARGLALVLRKHWWQAVRSIRQWPLLIESALSILWCHLILVVTIVLVVARIAGEPSATPILGSWAIGLLLLCAAHVMWGMRLDARNDPSIWSVLAWIPLFSVVYWTLSSVVVVSSTVPALLSRSKRHVVWTSARPTGPGLFDTQT